MQTLVTEERNNTYFQEFAAPTGGYRLKYPDAAPTTAQVSLYNRLGGKNDPHYMNRGQISSEIASLMGRRRR